MRIPLFAASLVLLSAATVRAEILYRVTPDPSGSRLTVELEFDADAPQVELQMPTWAPGLYAVENYWQALKEVTARDGAGRPLTVSSPRSDTWRIDTPQPARVRVRYDLPGNATDRRRGMFTSDDRIVHVSGPAAYLYVVGRKTESCRLELAIPADWKVAIGLNPARDAHGRPIFSARNYDVLADNPLTLGAFPDAVYAERGKEHLLAFRGPARDTIDRERARRMCQFVTRAATDFFGGAPYERYVWHFWASPGRDGAGGLEHASSTQMFLTSGLGPAALSGIAHEYFHLWNVKRIRSKALGPFDYTRLPQTGALWWLEGVTDYYAHLLPYRYGAWDRGRFFSDAARQVEEVRQNPARLEVSPYDAGYRVSEAVGSFSSGYRVNYYPTGFVLGLLLDIELRTRSGGRRSLDDVEKALWNLCRDERKPGFDEGEIRRQLVRAGGAELGALYDTWVMKPGELPVEATLARIGLELSAPAPGVRSTLRERGDITPEQKRLLDDWLRTRPDAGLFP